MTAKRSRPDDCEVSMDQRSRLKRQSLATDRITTRAAYRRLCGEISARQGSRSTRPSKDTNRRITRAEARRIHDDVDDYHSPWWDEEYEDHGEDENQQSEDSEDSEDEEEEEDDEDEDICYDQPSNNHKGKPITPQHDQTPTKQKPPPPIIILDDEEHATATTSNKATKQQQRPQTILTLRFTSGKLLASGTNHTAQSYTGAVSQQRAIVSKDIAQTELSHALANAAAAREEHNRAEAALTRAQQRYDEAASRRDAANKKVDELCEKVMRSRE